MSLQKPQSAIKKKMLSVGPAEKEVEKNRHVQRMIKLLTESNLKPRNKSQLRKPEYSKLLNSGVTLGNDKCGLVYAGYKELSSA